MKDSKANQIDKEMFKKIWLKANFESKATDTWYRKCKKIKSKFGKMQV